MRCIASTTLGAVVIASLTQECVCRGARVAQSTSSAGFLQQVDPPEALQVDLGDEVLRGSRLAYKDQKEMGEEELDVVAGVRDIIPNDLWGIRDMLLIGYSATFMKDGTEGARQVKDAALSLARLLPQLHPHAPCRTQVASALEVSSPAMDTEQLDIIKKAAASTWACLPAKYTTSSFKGPFTEEMVGSIDKAIGGRFPEPKNSSLLGACQDSLWPRTCSYWSSLHIMAQRADLLGKSKEFMGAIVPILAGGALLCEGCTLHFIAMHKNVLGKSFADDRQAGF
jgi:hypothetical protein